MKTFSIGAASNFTGIPGETIRIWERRYGTPIPDRSAAGHRRYSLPQVEWLRLVGGAVERGVRPSQAVRLSHGELEAMTRSSEPADATMTPELQRLCDAVDRRDGTDFISQLDAAWTSRTALRFASEIAAPLMDLLTLGLNNGVLDERRATFACRIFEDHIRTRSARFVADPAAPRVLLASTPDARAHACVRVAALLCAAEGATYVVLAAEPNTAHVRHAAIQMRADTVALHSRETDTQTQAMIHAWRRVLLPDVRLVVLGSGNGDVLRAPGVEVIEGPAEWHGWLRRTRAGHLSHAI